MVFDDALELFEEAKVLAERLRTKYPYRIDVVMRGDLAPFISLIADAGTEKDLSNEIPAEWRFCQWARVDPRGSISRIERVDIPWHSLTS